MHRLVLCDGTGGFFRIRSNVDRVLVSQTVFSLALNLCHSNEDTLMISFLTAALAPCTAEGDRMVIPAIPACREFDQSEVVTDSQDLFQKQREEHMHRLGVTDKSSPKEWLAAALALYNCCSDKDKIFAFAIQHDNNSCWLASGMWLICQMKRLFARVIYEYITDGLHPKVVGACCKLIRRYPSRETVRVFRPASFLCGLQGPSGNTDDALRGVMDFLEVLGVSICSDYLTSNIYQSVGHRIVWKEGRSLQGLRNAIGNGLESILKEAEERVPEQERSDENKEFTYMVPVNHIPFSLQQYTLENMTDTAEELRLTENDWYTKYSIVEHRWTMKSYLLLRVQYCVSDSDLSSVVLERTISVNGSLYVLMSVSVLLNAGHWVCYMRHCTDSSYFRLYDDIDNVVGKKVKEESVIEVSRSHLPSVLLFVNI
jgi:hypothetical protein